MLRYLTKEQQRQLIQRIQAYFLEERDEEIGIIAAERWLEFAAEEIGVYYYNRAIADARRLVQRQMEGLETELFILERPVQHK